MFKDFSDLDVRKFIGQGSSFAKAKDESHVSKNQSAREETAILYIIG